MCVFVCTQVPRRGHPFLELGLGLAGISELPDCGCWELESSTRAANALNHCTTSVACVSKSLSRSLEPKRGDLRFPGDTASVSRGLGIQDEQQAWLSLVVLENIFLSVRVAARLFNLPVCAKLRCGD